MKKVLLMTAGLLSIGLIAWKGERSAAGTPHTLLWKVSGRGLKKPSYLFGTMHVLCADEAALSKDLKAAIASCDEVYFEIKLDDMAAMLGAMKYMMMNDDKRLSDVL